MANSSLARVSGSLLPKAYSPSPLERMQLYASHLNGQADNLGHVLETARGAAAIAEASLCLQGKTNAAAANTNHALATAGGALALVRLPLDLIGLSSKDTIYERADNGAFKLSNNKSYVLRDPLKVALDCLVPVARACQVTDFLNTKAYNLPAKSATYISESTNTLWGVVIALSCANSAIDLHRACHINVSTSNDLKAKNSKITDKILECIKSFFDMVIWVFELVANSLNPSVGIAAGALHVLAGSFKTFIDIRSYKPAFN